MELRLGEDDVVVLGDVLTRYLGELSAEISHTDNPGYRRRLRERREALRRVLAALRAGEPAGAGVVDEQGDADLPPRTA
ncbi:MAG TPA: hypothetical protein VFS29_05375 [Motilibacteraceae bacterium]|nr:hypothetical protein [Motilibacteraceae bacterium]